MQKRILVVDDLTANRRILGKMLMNDYEIVEAAGGLEAEYILQAQYQTIDAVLLDIFMPDVDGYEVLAFIRKEPLLAGIPVIMITGSSDEQARVKALSMGANDFVTKPYNSEIIRHCLRNNVFLHESASIINALQRDYLTKLPTRDVFLSAAGDLIRQKPPGYYVMAFFDVDRFKVINDQYGSEQGDKLLIHIATVFRDGFESRGGICCRTAGDNFAVLYPASFMDSPEIIEIRNNASKVEDILTPIVFSIGRYLINDLSLSTSAMLDRAAMAAGSVKGRYDMKVAMYDESMRSHLIYEQEIVMQMETALKTSQFEVWFQPQYNHSTKALIGSEALVRWRRPDKGLIPPAAFIPIFEDNGFIYELDKFVWEDVCRRLRDWTDRGLEPLPVSVNVSRYDVYRNDVVDVITQLTDKYGIAADLLRLEITETAFSKSESEVINVVEKFISRGFTVEIDDFGSGYSSLNILKDVPAQIIKLDMRFLESGNSERGGNIVESVVRMAKWLGMSVIAEGVETIEQADYLRSIGCSYMQGYLYAKPMPVKEYEEFFQNARKKNSFFRLRLSKTSTTTLFGIPSRWTRSFLTATLAARAFSSITRGRSSCCARRRSTRR